MDHTERNFDIAGKKYSIITGADCLELLDHWEDHDAICEMDSVEKGDYGWYSIKERGDLNIHIEKAQSVKEAVEKTLTEQSDDLHELSTVIMEETLVSKFIPFEDVLAIVRKGGYTNLTEVAIALILYNSRLKFFNNGVVVNSSSDILVLDDRTGWTKAAALLIALSGMTEAPGQGLSQRASAFRYGPPRGCTYVGRDDRAIVEGVAVKSTQVPGIQQYGIGGDGRYAERQYLFFKTVTGKLRKVYVEGNLMFVSGMRGRSIVSRIPIKSVDVMEVGLELADGKQGLMVPTNAMFDVVVRAINAGNKRVSMWFTPKVLSGEIVCCEGPTTMTSYFRSKGIRNDVEFGPTIRACLLQSGAELGYVVNVKGKSYLLAHPYDSHGVSISKVGDGYEVLHSSVPVDDRHMVDDASNMFFG